MSNCYKCDSCNKHFDYKLSQAQIIDEIKVYPRYDPVLAGLRGYREEFWGIKVKYLRCNTKWMDLCDDCFKGFSRSIK